MTKPVSYVVPATAKHCELMYPHLREIDRHEMWFQGGWMPEEGLLLSYENSEEAYTVLMSDSDIPVMMFGISRRQSVFDNARSVWLLGTDRVGEIKKRFLKDCAGYFYMLTAGKTVYNYVLKDHHASLRWLKWLGFSIMQPEPYGWLQKPFHYVEREVPLCASLQSRQ